MKYRLRTQTVARHQDVFSRGGTGPKRPVPSMPRFNLPPLAGNGEGELPSPRPGSQPVVAGRPGGAAPARGGRP